MRLPLFYFLYYAAGGITVGYLWPHFKSSGFSGAQIATASSIQPLLTIAIPLCWGYLADRSGRPASLLRIASLGAALSFSLLLFTVDYRSVLGILILYSLFVTAIIALADSIAMKNPGSQRSDYARIRLWGSVGFMASTWGFSAWLEGGGSSPDAVVVAAVLMFAFVLASFRIPEAPGAPILQPPSLEEVVLLLRRPSLAIFLICTLLHWAALSPFHLFFAIHLRDQAAAPFWVGIGFAGAVIAEVAAMWGFRWLRSRASLLSLLCLSFAAGSLRWLFTGFASSGAAIAGLQLVHGLSFGVFFVASIAFLEQEVPPKLRATGRALFAAVVFGIGGVLGNLGAGHLYDGGGGELAFLAAAGIDLIPALLILLLFRARRPAPLEPGGPSSERGASPGYAAEA